MKKYILSVLCVLLSVAVWAGGSAESENNIIKVWTQEGTSEGAFQYVVSLTEAYMADNPDVVIEVLNKETEALREDFQNAALAGDPPDLLWTVNDHAGPFVAADLIRPVDDVVDLSAYVETVVMNGSAWGVPISSGNHLMLLYNKDIISSPPANTDELVRMGQQVSNGDVYGLVWNQLEPFWLVPWLGGFNGKVFAADGVTPTLDTAAMAQTLEFMSALKNEYGISPAEADYDGADTLFKEGKSAMIINGDWSLGGYREVMGNSLGVAPLPQVSATGSWPAPYTSGKYFMIPKDVPEAKLATVIDFIKFATSYDNQIAMVQQLSRLPALREALADPVVSSDPILQKSAEQMSYGTPMPSVIEMRCNWDAMKPELNAVLSGTQNARAAANAMQQAAIACVDTL